MKKKCISCGAGKAKRQCMLKNGEAICSTCCVEWFVDENVSERELDIGRDRLKEMGVAMSTVVRVAEQWSGAPDSAILEEMTRRDAVLLTKDRAFHNTVLSSGGVSYCILEDGNVTRKRIKAIPAGRILPGRGNLNPLAANPCVIACRQIVIDPTDERALKKQRTKRRRIRSTVGGIQNVDHVAVTVTSYRGLMGLVIQVVSNCGVPSFKGSEAFIRVSGDDVGEVVLTETLALLLRLHLEGCSIKVFYDTAAGISDPASLECPLYSALSAAFSAMEWIECSKGRHIDWLRKTTRNLWVHPTNMIVPSDVDAYRKRWLCSPTVA